MSFKRHASNDQIAGSLGEESTDDLLTTQKTKDMERYFISWRYTS